MHGIFQDLRFGLRMLRTSPRFSVIAVITLALGIGANVAIFTFVDAALLRPLPYRDNGRLMAVYETRQQTVVSQFEASYPDFQDWQKQNNVFDSLAGYSANAVVLTGSGTPELIPAGLVSDNFFQTLGVTPYLGRDFRSGEEQASAAPVIILSYSWWQKHFAGNRNAIGQTLNLDGTNYTIIAVLPADFHFALVGDPLIWAPLRPEGDMVSRRNLHWISVVGRLKPGASRQTAASGMNVVAQHLEQEYPASNRNLRAAVVPLTEVIVGQIRPMLLVLLVAVGLLLLIACANVANLLLARSASRRREMAVRAALGASRFRLMRQTFVEGIILSVVGGGCGLLAANWLSGSFIAAIPDSILRNLPYLKNVKVDLGVAGFAIGVSFITGVLFALAPALQLSGKRLADALRENTRSSMSPAWRRFASGLVVSEVAIAMVLMVGAGLLVKSLFRLLQVDLGFDHENILAMAVAVPDPQYSKPEQKIAFERTVLEGVKALPGVVAAGHTTALPLRGGTTANIRVMGQPYVGQGNEANSRTISIEYFQTLHAQLLQGRWFTEEDNADAPPRVIVNKTFADLYLANLDPLSQQILFTCCPGQKPRQIIGVVRDVKEGPLDAKATPTVYGPFLESPNSFFNLVVRTAQSPDSLVEPVQSTIRRLVPDAVIFGVETMDQKIQRSPAAFLHRYPAWLAGAFAFLALLLGSIGLYGLVAYSVSQRTQEIGIRMALGARRDNVLRMVLGQGLRLIVPGVAIGAAAAMAVGYLLRSLLFGVSAADPLVLSMVVLILATVTLVASYIPAYQATKVDPMVALRYE